MSPAPTQMRPGREEASGLLPTHPALSPDLPLYKGGTMLLELAERETMWRTGGPEGPGGGRSLSMPISSTPPWAKGPPNSSSPWGEAVPPGGLGWGH